MIAGLAYVLLSGMSVSAVRAFLMAMLVLAAWLSDRLGLTLRNVGLAAGAILLVNPVALFSAGFCEACRDNGVGGVVRGRRTAAEQRGSKVLPAARHALFAGLVTLCSPRSLQVPQHCR